MQKKIRQLFGQISEIDPPKDLADFVFSRIEKEKVRIAKRQLILSYFGFASSIILAIYVGITFGQTFLQAEFWTMLSLVFSDLAIVWSNLDIFALSLLETFPVVHAILFLAPIFLMLISISTYFTNKVNYKHKFNFLTS